MSEPGNAPSFHETGPSDISQTVREWQRERQEDLIHGAGGLAHQPPPAPPREGAPAETAGTPGLIGGERTAESIPAANFPPLPIEPDEQQESVDKTAAPEPAADSSVLESETTQTDLLPAARANGLEARLDEAQWRVAESIDSLEVARALIEEIGRVRILLDEGPAALTEAENLVTEIEYRISRARRVAARSTRAAVRILAYEIVWLVAMGVGLIWLPSLRVISGAILPAAAALIGGIGGAAGAIVGLWQNVGIRRDYSEAQNIWYYSQPALGIAAGAFVYLIIRAAIAITVGSGLEITDPTVIYAASAFAGYRLHVFTRLGAPRRPARKKRARG